MKNSFNQVRAILTGLVIGISYTALAPVTAVAQADASTTGSPAEVEELEINGQPPSLSLPQTPSSTENQEELQQMERDDSQVHDQDSGKPEQTDERLLQEQQEQAAPENINSPALPAAGSVGPEQDTPNRLEVP